MRAHPRSLMPGGKGDYTDWETNDTPAISDRNLTRLARLLEMAPAAAHRERLLAGVKAGLEQGAARSEMPERSAGDDRQASPVAGSHCRGGTRQRGVSHQCAPCHQTDGSGMERLAAPLRNSKWVLGREELLIRIVLHGLKGELLMPPMGTLEDRAARRRSSLISAAPGDTRPDRSRLEPSPACARRRRGVKRRGRGRSCRRWAP